MLIKNALKRLQKEGFEITHQWAGGVCYPGTVYARKQGVNAYVGFTVSSGGFGENAIASDFQVHAQDFRKEFKNLSQAIDCALLEMNETKRLTCYDS